MIGKRFTVLISVYKRENHVFLKEAIESIYYKQTLRPNEIVIVKDGYLTKELDEVLQEYKEKLPNVLKIVGYKENRGLGHALNYGLNACTNEIICRMDSDDISTLTDFRFRLKNLKTMKILPYLEAALKSLIKILVI